ncbi:FAD-dependent monooxygenase [Paracoccus thiocyanatus]|uniref:FAD-dependent monooxygenase n=1 Tax=Paracoccus thiocyanatus TaxID=34006 RepID=UPI002161D1C9|nr:FAD-dependent monooxygenase [Paracoccus thiocyanatus]
MQFHLDGFRPGDPTHHPAAPDGTAGNDGDVACRTMEMFNAFGFADRVMKEAYWVNEVTFWKPQDGDGPIMRHGRIRDTEDGLSEFPHVILNQARVHDFYLEAMRHAPTRLQPDYGLQLAGLTIPDDPAQPVEARLRPVGAKDESRDQIVRARYVVGCDGARSQVAARSGGTCAARRRTRPGA